jgi:hypothetical protein
MGDHIVVDSPRAVYGRRLLENQGRLAREQTWDRWLGYGKIFDFLVLVLTAIAFLHFPDRLWLLLIPAAIFLCLILFHERVLRRVRRFTRISDFYERGIARLENRWAGCGESGIRFLDPTHPYAHDLDLFGQGSLFELLCTSRTPAGEETLADWLLHPAAPDVVGSRHEAILEMKDQLGFQERLFLAGGNLRLGVHPEALAAWGEQKSILQSRWLPLLTVLTVSWIGAAVYFVYTLGSWQPLVLISLLNRSIAFFVYRRLEMSFPSIENASEGLQVFTEVLEIIEEEAFSSELLRRLRDSLLTARVKPSTAISRLRRIVSFLESRRNLLVKVVDRLVFFSFYPALAAQKWQRMFGHSIRGWLTTVGEFEAVASLAAYAAEHPKNVLPEFADEAPTFDAQDLAHPLLPEEHAIGNDLKLDRNTQLIVISGPNMAGKSTFLRGVGLNAVLAQCGAPVRAKRLRLSPLAVGASICVLDSLQGGVSRFYAEITRLKILSDMANGPIPLLFLLDELLSGTNSHDRYEGTCYVVEALVQQGAIGMVTTHDLALTQIPAIMHGAAANYHFEDAIEGGQLKFDFRLRPGIVRTTNALKLMRLVGLHLPG